LGFLVGLAIGVGAAVLLETLDTRIKSIEALAKYFDQTLLGVIGYDPEAPKKPLILQNSPQSKRAESFRQVRTNLQFVDIDHRPKSIVVTSSIPREGKSTTAINLAITIAQTGQPVFLIEGDLRRPKIAEYLAIEGNAGLTDVLVGRATIDEVMQPWGTTGNLWVLPAGPLPPNPSELLGSQSMADLVHHLERRATLIIDAPPLLPVTDAAVLSQLAGGAIIIIATGKARREQLRTAVNSVEGVGGKILGLVMNMAPAKGPDSHRYGYGYSYEYKTVTSRGKLDDHAPVIPAGLGGLPGVNGSETPVMPVGPVQAKKDAAGSDDGSGGDGAKPDAVRAASTPSDPSARVDKTAAPQEPPPPPPPPPAVQPPVPTSSAPLKPPRKRKSDSVSATASELKGASPSVLVDRALGRGSGNSDPALAAPLTDAIEVQSRPASSTASQPPLEQAVASEDKVIGHSLKVPLPEPVVDDPPMPFEPDVDPVGDWTPPRPRPAFDPLTAPLDQIHPDN
jgi:capsular exopolysaccharide synthesis family protein